MPMGCVLLEAEGFFKFAISHITQLNAPKGAVHMKVTCRVMTRSVLILVAPVRFLVRNFVGKTQWKKKY